MIRKLIDPDGQELIFERKVVRANGYRSVMSFWLNGYGIGSVYQYDRNGKLVLHATVDHPLSYKELRDMTKNFGNDIKILDKITRKILEERKND